MTAEQLKTAATAVVAAVLFGSLSACGKDEILDTCEDPQPIQAEAKRITVPEDLDPLDELREIPIPKAETKPRPPGARCLESPPSVLSK